MGRGLFRMKGMMRIGERYRGSVCFMVSCFCVCLGRMGVWLTFLGMDTGVTSSIVDRCMGCSNALLRYTTHKQIIKLLTKLIPYTITPPTFHRLRNKHPPN